MYGLVNGLQRHFKVLGHFFRRPWLFADGFPIKRLGTDLPALEKQLPEPGRRVRLQVFIVD
jgi:hypothetical protein